ncbi:UNVERIFIED_CONTAM: hypothetical protein Slati_1812600 [Sesamum latifolium]|uniref:Retrotransposon gag domain-containing protein n=1 Tax=Sesamum latifolium TaxID=2727402 RepID=A0AAW2WY47_9LAMI
MRRERKSNNHWAPGGRKATEDLESKKSRSELKATEDLESRKSRRELKATEDLENRWSRSKLPLPMIQLTPEALRQMIEEASAQAASRANDEHGPVDQQTDDWLEEEVESRPSLPEDELPPPPPPPRGAPPEEHRPQRRGQAATRQASIGRTENRQTFPLVVAPPRRSPFAAHILAEAVQTGIKIPDISKYDGTNDPQDRFLAKVDLLDISDAAYCKIFRTTLAGKAMTWFNQLPIGTIDSFEQLSQHFLHHFAINKRYPKTASYLFTVVQREHESLRVRAKVSEAVLEVPHVNPELLASIMQQNLRSGRFRESIAGKPPATLDELLVRAEKYIRIEETSWLRAATPSKRRVEEGDHSRRQVMRTTKVIEGTSPPRYNLVYPIKCIPRRDPCRSRTTGDSPLAAPHEGKSQEDEIEQILSISQGPQS